MQKGRAKARKKIKRKTKKYKRLICAKSRNDLQKTRKRVIKNYENIYIIKSMPKAERACFFVCFQIVVKLPLLFRKNFYKVVCVDRLVQSGAVPSQKERGGFMPFSRSETRNKGEKCCCN